MDDQALIAVWKGEEQQPFQGWDFSHLNGRWHEDQPSWSYEALVRQLLPQADSLLDMGTGGGEVLLSFKDTLPARTVATEGYPPNFSIAQSNLKPHGIQVVFYDCGLDARLPFPDNDFAAIINRHEAYDGLEIARVLRPGGVFLTQQVDGRDLDDMLAIFGVQPAYTHVNLTNCRHELEDAGLIIERADEWAGYSTFDDVGALVYFLHNAPWDAPEDFSVERYADQLLELYRNRQPLRFTSRRFVLKARKPTSVT